MNILLPKINLLKDISAEYASSIKSVQIVQKECEQLLNRLEFELTLRSDERNRFITKVGVTLRNILLDDFRGLVGKIHFECCRHEEIYIEMIEQYRVMQQTIKNTEFACEELQKVTKWNREGSNYRQLLHLKGQTEILGFNKENVQFQERVQEKNANRGEWRFAERSQLSRERNSKNWSRIILQNKERKEDLMNLQKKQEQTEIAELNAIIDECLSCVGNFEFISEPKKQEKPVITQSLCFSKQTLPEVINTVSHGVSLGLQSLNEEVNLLCTEQLEDFHVSRVSELQRITEREEEYSDSSSNPTPHKKLKESSD